MAASLLTRGSYQAQPIEIGIVAIGKKTNGKLRKERPDVLQLTWSEAACFIFNRFSKYKEIKREHPQWDRDGHLLWRIFECSASPEQFSSAFELNSNSPTGEEIAKYICEHELAN